MQKEGEDAGEFIREISTLCDRYNQYMAEDDKMDHVAENVHPKYKEVFAYLNAHSSSLEMVENSLRGAMNIVAKNAQKTKSATVAFASETSGAPMKRSRSPSLSASTSHSSANPVDLAKSETDR